MIVTIGMDIGQRIDPTAVAVAQLDWRPWGDRLPAGNSMPMEDHYIIRHLERLPLGVGYPAIVNRLAVITRWVDERVMAGTLRDSAGQLEPDDYADMKVYADATGVGIPVVGMLQAAGVRVIGVYFNHGDRRVEQQDATTKEYRVALGKAYMVSRLQALLQTRRLHLPDTPEAHACADELMAYEIRVDEKANDTYGAFRIGAHDDLVTALGLAVNKPPHYGGMLASSAGHIAMEIPGWATAEEPINPYTSYGNGLDVYRSGWGKPGSL